MQDYQQLKKLIENYTHDERPIYNGFDKTEIIGYTVSAPSIIRKGYTIIKINNLISKYNLSLKVFELPEMDKTDRFVISKI